MKRSSGGSYIIKDGKTTLAARTKAGNPPRSVKDSIVKNTITIKKSTKVIKDEKGGKNA